MIKISSKNDLHLSYRRFNFWSCESFSLLFQALNKWLLAGKIVTWQYRQFMFILFGKHKKRFWCKEIAFTKNIWTNKNQWGSSISGTIMIILKWRLYFICLRLNTIRTAPLLNYNLYCDRPFKPDIAWFYFWYFFS